MKITVSQIMAAKNAGHHHPGVPTGIQDAISAAFWAGEAKARAEEREANRAAARRAPRTRYHRIVAATIAQFNRTAAEGLRAESAEFAGWDHDLTTVTEEAR